MFTNFAWSTPIFSVIARYYWAAACGGEEGIVQLVQQLTAELKLCMQQLGVSQLRQLNPRCWMMALEKKTWSLTFTGLAMEGSTMDRAINR